MKTTTSLLLVLYALTILSTSTFSQKKSDLKNGKLSYSLKLLQQDYSKSKKTPIDFGGLVRTKGELVAVQVRVKDPEKLLSEFKALGMESPEYLGELLEGWIPVGSLEGLAKMSEVKHVSAIPKPQLSVGRVDNEADRAMQTDALRQEMWLDGEGVKIGVISDSFNGLGNMGQVIASGDLPGPGNPNGYTQEVHILRDDAENPTDEGKGMAELIHDIVPAADLAFHTGFAAGKIGFANAVRNLANAGCDVIVDDLYIGGQAIYQKDVVAQAYDDVFDAGIVGLTAAGNSANEAYDASFNPSNEVHNVRGRMINERSGQNDLVDVGRFIFHDFDPSEDNESPFLEVSSRYVGTERIILQWSEAYQTICENCPEVSDFDLIVSTTNDFENATLYHITQNGEAIAYMGGDNNLETGEAYEFGLATFSNSYNNQTRYIAVGKYLSEEEETTPELLEYLKNIQFKLLFMDGIAHSVVPGLINGSTVMGHCATEKVLAIGAVNYQSTPAFGGELARADYSSIGGGYYYFDENGNSLMQRDALGIMRRGVFQRKPDIMAPSSTRTSSFGMQDRDNFMSYIFPGTSAAAPHAAAVAAMMLQVTRNQITPQQVQDVFRQTATDMDNDLEAGFQRGYDVATGYGYINAIAAVQTARRHLDVGRRPALSFVSVTERLCSLDDTLNVFMGYNLSEEQQRNNQLVLHLQDSEGGVKELGRYNLFEPIQVLVENNEALQKPGKYQLIATLSNTRSSIAVSERFSINGVQLVEEESELNYYATATCNVKLEANFPEGNDVNPSYTVLVEGLPSPLLDRNYRKVIHRNHAGSSFTLNPSRVGMIPGQQYKIRLRLDDGCDWWESEPFRVELGFSNFGFGSRLSGDIANNLIKAYPNPFTDNVTIRIASDIEVKSLKVRSMLGHEVYSQNALNVDNKSMELELDMLNKGTYLLEIIGNDGKKYYQQILKN